MYSIYILQILYPQYYIGKMSSKSCDPKTEIAVLKT